MDSLCQLQISTLFSTTARRWVFSLEEEVWPRWRHRVNPNYPLPAGSGGNVFRITPPMCITEQDVEFSLQVLKIAFDNCLKRRL